MTTHCDILSACGPVTAQVPANRTPARARARLRAQRAKSRAGHTLIEMALSCAVVAVLMLAIGSALHLTLVTTGDVTQAAALNRETAGVADQVGSDLNLAMNFTERTETAVTFTVPDRQTRGDADRGPDSVRYAWWPPGAAASD